MAKLFEPIQTGSLHLKNRIVMAPMCMYEVKKEDGILTPFHFAHYTSRSIGGVGLIFLEATAVTKQGRITANDLGIWNGEQTEKLAELVEQIHYTGSKIGIQLAHAGRKATDEPETVAPSALLLNDSYKLPKELTTNEVRQIVEDFRAGAKRCQKAGFDAVQLHAAHGYLVNQFLSPLTNKRNDAYGSQTLENRFRLLKEITQAVQKEFNGSIWVRISATDYDPLSTSMEEFGQILKWLKELSVEVVDVSTGGLLPKGPEKVFPGYQTGYAAQLKNETDLLISTVGKLGDPLLANYILESQQADLISLGRPLLINPNWAALAAKELRQPSFKAYNDSYGRGFNE